jgi:hypothetical protein
MNMKSLIIIISLCLSLFAEHSVHAQSFGSQLKNKVVNKLENKANEKIDKSIDSAVDKPVDKTEEKVKESVKSDNSSNSNTKSNTNASSNQNPTMSESDMSSFMNMMNTNVKLSDYPDVTGATPSSFIGSFDMIVESYKKNGAKEDGTKISWYVDKFDLVMLPEMEGSNGVDASKIIINRKKALMIVLTNSGGNKMGMVMKMSDIDDLVANSEFVDEQIDDFKIQVFKNETQVIEGKKCFKIVASDDEYITESWITEDIAIRIDQIFGYMSMQSKGENKYEEQFGNIQGWAMKSTSTNKVTGEKTIMYTKNIKQGNVPAGITSTEGYQLMEMPDMSNFMNNGK